MSTSVSWLTFKRLLLLFWAVWLSLVVAGNVCDALREAGLLGESWRYASGNYQAIREVLAPYELSDAVATVLFAGVIAWEIVSTALFWWTGVTFRGFKAQGQRGRIVATFAVGLGLWAAFQIACEALASPAAWRVAGTHRLLFTEQLATLLAIALLPDD
jgi:hypothetical protein